VASIQVDLSPALIRRLRGDLLRYLRDTGAHAVLLDLSGVELISLHEFEGLRQILKSARMMGADGVMTGLRAEVVSALVDLGVDTAGISTAGNLDDGFELVRGGSEQG
jgi:anti-anti-sigma regulatory factor